MRDDLREDVGVDAGDVDLEEESVELGLRDGIRALEFDRVLRGEHEERIGQGARLAEERDGMFLHGFEHGGLRLRRRAVDFVGEQDVREDRSFDESEGSPSLSVFFEHGCSGNIGRGQVRSELNASEIDVENLCDRLYDERLGETWHALQKAVSLGKDRGENLANGVALSDDDLGEFVFKRGARLPELLQ